MTASYAPVFLPIHFDGQVGVRHGRMPIRPVTPSITSNFLACGLGGRLRRSALSIFWGGDLRAHATARRRAAARRC